MKKIVITFFIQAFFVWACSGLSVDDIAVNQELLSECIAKHKPEIVLNVEDFTSIEDCLNYRESITGSAMIIFNRDYEISSAILIPSNTIVVINGCTIKQANYTFDNVFRSSNVILDDNDFFYIPKAIDSLENISIIGIGDAIIQGPDINRKDITNNNSPMVTADLYGARTHMISLCLVTNGEISGLKFIRPRGWSICFEFCSYFTVTDICFISTDMDSPYDFHATGDGINLRRGCHHFNIYTIIGSTTDDLIALNTTPAPKEVIPNRYHAMFTTSYSQSIALQNNRLLDIHDVHINNIVKNGQNDRGSGALVRLNCFGNTQLYNIYISQGEYSGLVSPGNHQAILFSNYSGRYISDSIHDVYIYDIKIKNTSQTIDNVLDSGLKVKNVWASKLYNGSGGGVYRYLYDEGLVVTD